MSLRTMFDRTVDLVLTSAAGENARGNEQRGTSTIAGVPCRRGQLAAAEDNLDRDQQARTFVYYFDSVHVDADRVEHDLTVLTGRDRIIDGDDRFEILGAPVVATSRGRVRHVEARAYLVAP